MKRKIICLLLAVIVALSVLAGCSSTVDKPCSYCNHSPSKEYKKQDGSMFYVCEECSSTCMICNRAKATKHYESLLGIVFVCDNCYKQVAG